MNQVARTIIILGVVLVIIGIIMLLLQKMLFFGKLPGDIIIRKKNFTLYFPLATSIIISIIISLILYIVSKFK